MVTNIQLSERLKAAANPQDDLGIQAKAFIDEAMASGVLKSELNNVHDRIRNGKGTDLDWRVNEMMIDLFVAVRRGLDVDAIINISGAYINEPKSPDI